MRRAGIVLGVVYAGCVGVRIARAQKKRCSLERQLVAGLQLMKNEVDVCAAPWPRAFAVMAVAVDGPLEQLFSAVAREMDRNRFLTPLMAVRQALREIPELPAGDAAQQTLLELAARLGRYDTDSQLQGIDLALLRLTEELHKAEQERGTRSKTYQTLGICTGLAVAILLM